MESNLKLTHVPHSLAATIGFTYISGYLIDFFYFTSRGVSDVGGDLFKLRYIHVGIYFDLTLALCVATPIFIWLHFFPPSNTSTRSSSIRTVSPESSTNNSMVWVPVIYQFSLFVPTILTPNDFFSRPEHPMRWFAILGLIGSALVIYLIGQIFVRYHPEEKQGITTVMARTIIASMLICDIPTVTGLFPTFSAMFPNVIFYILFCIALSAVITLGFLQIHQSNSVPDVYPSNDSKSHGGGINFALIRQLYLYVISSILILFLILMTYAYVVFPFIPVEKGGGDFNSATRISVVTQPGAVQADIKDSVLIYSTSTSLFFAKPEPKNDACDWRATGVIPDLIEVRREDVRSISNSAPQANCF